METKEMKFVDTNMFLRYFINDDQVKSKKVRELFIRVKENKKTLFTSESVIGEIIYVLSSKNLPYNVPRKIITELILTIIRLKNMKLDNKATIIRALDIYANNLLDFEDAIAVSVMESKKITKIYSYDNDFEKFKKIERIEP
ncbi:type II toxin-antitoxin system VapC family toxin [Patescibacteria group bacterium]|nr:type II toxin-antitoxin system VapC family toxin [Patescibacteria group bacterium]